jgi:hypothetical protein
VAMRQLEPLGVLVFCDADGATVKDRLIDQLAILLLEHSVERKERVAFAAAAGEALEQVLAKQPSHDRGIDRQLLKRECPAIADEHRAVGRNVEHALCTGAPLGDVMGFDGFPVERDCGIGTPGSAHPDAKDLIDEHIGLTCFPLSGLKECGDYLFAVESSLEPLKRQTLASSLCPHQHGQVAKGKINLSDLRKILDVQPRHGSEVTMPWR